MSAFAKQSTLQFFVVLGQGDRILGAFGGALLSEAQECKPKEGTP